MLGRRLLAICVIKYRHTRSKAASADATGGSSILAVSEITDPKIEFSDPPLHAAGDRKHDSNLSL